MPEYSKRHLPYHLLEAGMYNELKLLAEGQQERVDELERQNEFLLNTIADDNKHLAEKDRVIALLRAAVEELRDLLEDKTHFTDRDDIVYFTADYVESAEMSLQAAIDGGALDEDGEK